MNNRTLKKTCSALSLVAILATTVPSVALAAPCASPKERSGLELRVLQSELMVAALTCAQRPEYNAFVTTFKPQIQKQSAHLKSFYQKAFGASATKKLNKLITRLANQASQRSLTQSTSEFCAASQVRFDQILAAKPSQLIKIANASPTANDHGFSACVQEAKADATKLVELTGSSPIVE